MMIKLLTLRRKLLWIASGYQSGVLKKKIISQKEKNHVVHVQSNYYKNL